MSGSGEATRTQQALQSPPVPAQPGAATASAKAAGLALARTAGEVLTSRGTTRAARDDAALDDPQPLPVHRAAAPRRPRLSASHRVIHAIAGTRPGHGPSSPHRADLRPDLRAVTSSWGRAWCLVEPLASQAFQ